LIVLTPVSNFCSRLKFLLWRCWNVSAFVKILS